MLTFLAQAFLVLAMTVTWGILGCFILNFVFMYGGKKGWITEEIANEDDVAGWPDFILICFLSLIWPVVVGITIAVVLILQTHKFLTRQDTKDSIFGLMNEIFGCSSRLADRLVNGPVPSTSEKDELIEKLQAELAELKQGARSEPESKVEKAFEC